MDSESLSPSISITPWRDHGASLRTWETPEQSVRWAFGLQWTATLGRRSRRWLFDQLRRQNVRWYVSSGAQGELIGMDMAGLLSLEGAAIYSAAVGYARTCTQGTHLLRLVTSQDRQWVVGVHQGSVLSHTDCWVDAPTGDLLQASLEQRFADLQVQTVAWPESEAQTPVEGLAFLQQKAGDVARCRRLRCGVGSGTVWLMLGASVCALGAGFMWLSLGWWPLTKQPSAPSQLVAPEPSLPTVYVHQMTDLAPLWQMLSVLPVDPDGWLLQQVDCHLDAQRAFCRADYRRRRATTDNEALKALAPSAWRLKPVSLDESSYEAHIGVSAQALHQQTLAAVEQWLVTLQRQSATTPALRLGSWREQVLVSGDLSVSLRSREISLRLPVRQLAALQAWSLPVFWQSIRLEVAPNATVDQHNSYLMLHLKGELRALGSKAV